MSTTISFNLKVNGVLTDATSVVLSDPTSTFGVRRTDNSGVVVAAGTVMNHDGTGQYSYTFADPSPGLTYESQIKYVYGGNTFYEQKFNVGATGGYGLTDLQKMVRYSARNSKDSTEYVGEQIDFAIQQAAREWIRITKATRQLDSLTLSVGSTALPSLPSGFLPEFLLEAYLTISGQQIRPCLEVVSYEAFLDAQYARHTTPGTITPGNGRPHLLAFYNRTNGVVGPLPPDQVYQVALWWTTPFTTWTPGVTPSTVTSFNLDDDALQSIASLGAPFYLQRGEPENAAAANAAHAQFLIDAKDFARRGSGGKGVQVIHRDNPDWMRGGGCL